MAIADKNILITPNTSGILGNQPSVVFTGADSSIGDSAAITVTARPENSGTLSFTGTAGQLFSITNSLEGTIFAVNDVSGIPSLEIDAAGIIKLAEYNGRILLGGATDDSTSLLQLNGHMHLADNGEIRLGNDSDLKIHWDGTDGHITAAGTLNIDGTGETLAKFIDDGAVELYHNNVKKLETTATGATVTGTALATTDTDTSNTGNITLDFGANQNFVLTLTGNVTLDNPSTEQVGQSGFIAFIQDGSGSRTVSLGTDYETAGGQGLTLTSTASATDIVPYVVVASNRILLGTPQLAFS